MGKISSAVPDSAIGVQAGTFSAIGQSNAFLAERGFNITLSGTFVATVVLERSFDGATTWHPVFTPEALIARSFTGPTSFWHVEPEAGVLYRLNCTSYTSGTVTYRLSR